MAGAEKPNSNDLPLDELPPLVPLTGPEYAEASIKKAEEVKKAKENVKQNSSQERTDFNKDLLKKAPKTLTDKNIISSNSLIFSKKIDSDRNMISLLREQLTIQGLSKNPEKDASAIAASVGRELGPLFQNRFTTILKAGSTLECRNGILGVTDEKGHWTGTDLSDAFEAPIDESLLIGAKAKEEPKKPAETKPEVKAEAKPENSKETAEQALAKFDKFVTDEWAAIVERDMVTKEGKVWISAPWWDNEMMTLLLNKVIDNYAKDKRLVIEDGHELRLQIKKEGSLVIRTGDSLAYPDVAWLTFEKQGNDQMVRVRWTEKKKTGTTYSEFHKIGEAR